MVYSIPQEKKYKLGLLYIPYLYIEKYIVEREKLLKKFRKFFDRLLKWETSIIESCYKCKFVDTLDDISVAIRFLQNRINDLESINEDIEWLKKNKDKIKYF